MYLSIICMYNEAIGIYGNIFGVENMMQKCKLSAQTGKVLDFFISLPV